MNKFTAIIAAAAFVCAAAHAEAAKTMFHSFETGAQAALLAIGTSDGQCPNSGNIVPPATVKSGFGTSAANTDTAFCNATEFVSLRSNSLTVNWSTAPVAYADQYAETAVTQLVWANRIDHSGIAIPTSAEKLHMDVYNNSDYPVQGAILFREGTAGAYGRTPFFTLNSKVWTKLSWDRANDTVYRAVTGNGPAGGKYATDAAVNFRGLLVYTLTQPTAATLQVFADNVVTESSQSDNEPPLPVQMVKVEQGSAAGKLKVTWLPTTEVGGSAIAKYTVYAYPKAACTASTYNFNTAVAGTTKSDFGPTATTGEIDVPTGEPVYVNVTATDTATPIANESSNGVYAPLGAVLAADGSAPKDLLITDLKRYVFGVEDFRRYGYNAMSAYYARAWETNLRTMVSANAAAVESGAQALTPKADGIVIWCKGLDGTTAGTSMTLASTTALDTFVKANGKLWLSGQLALQGLATSAEPQQLAFLNDTLKIASATAVTSINLDIGSGAMAYTGADVFNMAAGANTANTGLTAAAGGTAYVGLMDAATGGNKLADAMVVRNGSTVAMGFSFEMLRHTPTSNVTGEGDQAMALRASFANSVVGILFTSDVSDWSQF